MWTALTGTVVLKARFDNSDRQLWPGQFVRVELELFSDNGRGAGAEHGGADQPEWHVRVHARRQGQGGGAPGDGRVGVVGDRTVIEKGITVGERVVTDGQGKLAPGSKVAIKDTPAPTRGDAPIKDGATARPVDAKGGSAP